MRICNGFCGWLHERGKPSNKNVKIINHGGMIEIISDAELDCWDPQIMAMLAHAITSWPTMHSKSSRVWDFFEHEPKDIVEYHPEDPTRFMNKLHYSMRSQDFVHWADMLPWLVGWLTNFLEKNNISLDIIKKLRFKERVTGNMEYIVRSDKDMSLEQSSSVFWEFIADSGSTYYFYWKQISHDYGFRVFDNKLPDTLIRGNIKSSSIHSSKDITKLGEQPEEQRNKYIEKMNQNMWYARSTILDTINLIFQEKFHTGWLIIWYEDLRINKKFEPDALLDGNCHIAVSISPDIRTMKAWWWHKVDFSVNHEHKWQIASWVVMLFSKKKCM